MTTYKINGIRQNQFIQVPKELLYNEKYKGVSNKAKLTFAVLLHESDVDLSKDYWTNENPIIYPKDEIIKILQISVKTCTKLYKELLENGLINEISHKDKLVKINRI